MKRPPRHPTRDPGCSLVLAMPPSSRYEETTVLGYSVSPRSDPDSCRLPSSPGKDVPEAPTEHTGKNLLWSRRSEQSGKWMRFRKLHPI